MGFPFFEKSRNKGAPVSLFYFKYGPGTLNYYAFTNAEQSIRFNDIDFAPEPMTHDKLVSTGTPDQKTLTVSTRGTNPVAELFAVYPPSHTITLIIYQGHANDPDNDFRPRWNGRVVGCNWDAQQQAALSCEPVASTRNRPGLRRHYQFGCPHVLYGQGPGKCNASKSAATSVHTVDTIDGSYLVLPAGWVESEMTERYVNGMVEWTRPDGRREIRTILQIQNSRRLLLSGVPVALSPGDEVNVVYGCAHTREACLKWHANIYNFGGCSWIPVENPIGQRNNFY